MNDTTIPNTEQNSDPGVEKVAKRLGWVPQSAFKGDSSKWVDAATFVERVEPIAGFVEHRVGNAEREVSSLRGTIGALEQREKESRQAIKDLRDFNEAETKRAVEKARVDLLAELKAAKKAGDVDAEVEIQSELSRLDRSATSDAKGDGKGTTASTTPAPQYDQAFVQWANDTPWYGRPGKDEQRMTAMSSQIATELRAEGNTQTGRTFLEAVRERVEELFSARGESSKAAAGGASGDSSRSTSGGGKGWEDIPSGERAQIDRVWKDKLVGPSKTYKTVADFHKSYGTRYWNT
jgi:hypothetical protein